MARWWFQIIFVFSSLPGEMIHFDQYFSNGLKPPTRWGLEYAIVRIPINQPIQWKVGGFFLVAQLVESDRKYPTVVCLKGVQGSPVFMLKWICTPVI